MYTKCVSVWVLRERSECVYSTTFIYNTALLLCLINHINKVNIKVFSPP